MLTNTLVPYIKRTEGQTDGSGTDWRGLGRWSWYLLEGTHRHRTHIIPCYNVERSKPEGLQTVYQQHLRYMEHKDIWDIEPRDLFRLDLLAQLKTWVSQGDRIILTMDANDHVLRGRLGRNLVDPANGLGLEEKSHEVWGDEELNTWIDSSEPIDGVWVSTSLEVTGLKILPFYEGMCWGPRRHLVRCHLSVPHR